MVILSDSWLYCSIPCPFMNLWNSYVKGKLNLIEPLIHMMSVPGCVKKSNTIIDRQNNGLKNVDFVTAIHANLSIYTANVLMYNMLTLLKSP